MVKSKFLMLIIGILMLCLVLVCLNLSDDFYEKQDDIAYIWMEDENGNVKLISTTETYYE